MEEIKQKHGLDDNTLKEVLDAVELKRVETQVEQPELPPSRGLTEEEQMMPKLFSKIAGGDFTMVDYLMWSDMQDRREERRRRHEREDQQPQATPEKVAEAVVKGIKEAVGDFIGKPKSEEEIPSWAKPIVEQQKTIMEKLTKEEEEKRLKETVASATKPIEEKLVKTEEELKKTREEIKESSKPKKGELETTKDTLQTLVEIDTLRGKGEQLPAGTPGEITVATKTIDKGEKILTKGMEDVKETVSSFMEFQLEREKRLYQQQAPKLPEVKEEEKIEVLKKAAEEGGA